MLITPAYAQTDGGGMFELFFPLILVFAIIYFLVLRPQQKRQREHTDMIAGLRRGDQVVTQGGLIGRIAKVHEDELDIDLSDTTRVSVVKSMIVSVRSKPAPASEDDAT